MARGINKVILIGNLGDEPMIRQTKNGTNVANISLVTNEYRRDSQGNGGEYAEWHRVVLWDRLAKVAQDYLHKGSQVYIEGRLRSRSYEDNKLHDENGNPIKRNIVEIYADELQMLGSRPQGQGQGEGGYQRSQRQGGYGQSRGQGQGYDDEGQSQRRGFGQGRSGYQSQGSYGQPSGGYQSQGSYGQPSGGYQSPAQGAFGGPAAPGEGFQNPDERPAQGAFGGAPAGRAEQQNPDSKGAEDDELPF
ncbi:MAG: single-stranded DNA-binding protein [Succinivibrionaceae bacterium]|nr:single-stranded DNA-binding protein [Succinivibrionaceae bacterium]